MQANTTETGSPEEADKKYRAHIQRMLTYLEWLEKLYAETVNTVQERESFKKKFEKSTAHMEWDSGFVYLAKLCTSIERQDKDGKVLGAEAPFAEGQKIILGYDHLKLTYDAVKLDEEKTNQTFSVAGALLDYKKGTPQDVEMALMERAKMALLAVNSAKMMGWEYISFPKVTDPVELYMLQQISKTIDIKINMPDFDPASLPDHISPDRNMLEECNKAIEIMVKEPMNVVVVPYIPEEEKPIDPETVKRAAENFFSAPKAA